MFYLSKENPLPPRVILVQALLRKQGFDVPITGKWDQKTNDAVAKYRTGIGLAAQGPVDKNVFPYLIQDTKLKVIHSVDSLAGAVSDVTAKHLKKAGISPIMNPEARGAGVKTAIDLIIKRAKDHKIALLCFYGHGNRGVWISVALGDPVHSEKGGKPADYEKMKADYYSYIDYSHYEKVHRKVLSQLKPLFAPFASAEIHSCKIGNQWELLYKMADTWGVPVSGGIDNQTVGEPYTNEYGQTYNPTFQMEGPIQIAYPNNMKLDEWAAKVENTLPSLPRMVNQVQNAVSDMINRR